MTDQIPAEKVREIIHVNTFRRVVMPHCRASIIDQLEALLPSPPRPDLPCLEWPGEQQPAPAPPSTLTVGSKWDDDAALTRACEKSVRDQIVVLDADGYAFVWSWDANWWEGSAPPRTGPYTIIHPGRGAVDAAD